MQPQPLIWPGGEHDFALALGNVRAIQERCKAGPPEIMRRLRFDEWHVDDLYEVIRQGLIGGGMDRKEANELVSAMFDQHPYYEFVMCAQGIMALLMIGADTDEKPQADGEGGPDEPGKRLANGTSAQSTSVAE